jgi:hypothetical protein
MSRPILPIAMTMASYSLNVHTPMLIICALRGLHFEMSFHAEVIPAVKLLSNNILSAIHNEQVQHALRAVYFAMSVKFKVSRLINNQNAQMMQKA